MEGGIVNKNRPLLWAEPNHEFNYIRLHGIYANSVLPLTLQQARELIAALESVIREIENQKKKP
jgi:hypothetical protein